MLCVVETLLLNVVQLLIAQLENDSDFAEDIVNTIAPLIADEVAKPTKEDALAFLGGLEEMIVELLDKTMETLYYSIGFENGSRTALTNMLVALQGMAQNGNKKDIEDLSERLQVKNIPEDFDLNTLLSIYNIDDNIELPLIENRQLNKTL